MRSLGFRNYFNLACLFQEPARGEWTCNTSRRKVWSYEAWSSVIDLGLRTHDGGVLTSTNQFGRGTGKIKWHIV